MENFKNVFLTAVLFVLALGLTVCLIKAIITRGIASRIVLINMISTFVIMCIALLSVLLDESYLCDIAMIYALASFISAVVLTKVYTGIIGEKQSKAAKSDPPSETSDSNPDDRRDDK